MPEIKVNGGDEKWKTRCMRGGAVSYTHLDVYKRQVRDKLAEYKVQEKRSKEPEKNLSQAVKKKVKPKER